jgi:hypothetical protein
MVEKELPRTGLSFGSILISSPRRARLYVDGTAAGLKPGVFGFPSADVEKKHSTFDDFDKQPGYVTLLARPRLDAAAKIRDPGRDSPSSWLGLATTASYILSR